MATISFKQFISPQPVGGPSKRKKIRGPWGDPVCPLVKTALLAAVGGRIIIPKVEESRATQWM